MSEQQSRAGTQFGPYLLDALLGAGGMGEVYRAHDTVRDREVAVKLLHARLAGDATFQERFRREAQAVAKLGEPHIIPIHDYGEIDGVLYLDMRLVEGEDLRARLNRTGALSEAAGVAIAEQVAAALDAAHAAGLVHRDVKPENVLLTAHDFAYLVDFGIAHQDADTRLTQTGTAIGSLAYMAPEQLDGLPATAASDVYSLAAVTFEMLAGVPPFPGATVSQILRATVMNDVPSLRQRVPGISPQVDAVVTRALDKDPVRRFPSAGAFAAALREGVGGTWPDAGSARTMAMDPMTVDPMSMNPASNPGPAYDPTMIGQRPPAAPTTRPQTAPQHLSGPQSFTDPTQIGSMYTGPQVGAAAYSAGPGTTGPQMNYHGYPNYPPASPAQREGKAAQVILGGIIVLLLLALAGMGVYWFGFRDSGGTTTASPSGTVTLTQTVDAPPPSEQPSASVTAPSDTMKCSERVGVSGGMTSCEFAEEVASAYLAAGSHGEARMVTAASPVTHQEYRMDCRPDGGVVLCRGGDRAVVVIFP